MTQSHVSKEFTVQLDALGSEFVRQVAERAREQKEDLLSSEAGIACAAVQAVIRALCAEEVDGLRTALILNGAASGLGALVATMSDEIVRRASIARMCISMAAAMEQVGAIHNTQGTC